MKIALVTGASSGLGREFVRQLGADGSLDEIWAVARREDRLTALQKYTARPVRPIPMDLTQREKVEELKAMLSAEKPDIAVLVNAAGMGRIGPTADIPDADNDAMIDLNCRAAVDVTAAALPYLRRGSRVLEICSTAAFQPLGGLGVYAASKSFLLSYSRSLHYEVRTKGILVTAVCPYWIKDTEFIPVARETKDSTAVRHFPFASKCRHVVTWALNDATLGFSVSTPGPVCTLHRLVAKFIPRDLLMLGWAGLRRM